MTLLVLMGSGETAPAMVKIHRRILELTGPGPSAMLDTPYGFQDNADSLTARTREYFRESVGVEIDVARWRRADVATAQREATLSMISQARWLFAGPGSPTYALRHWLDTPLPAAMRDLLNRGGTVVLGSAAAVTAGAYALPVYEIYKVGAEPGWVVGLDLFGSLLGADVAVIPHFDNAEGGTYDTRFCYLGERRLSLMEAQLPKDAGIVGVDEHTAVLVDLGARTVEVTGIGAMTVRRAGQSRLFEAGTTLSIAELAEAIRSGTGPHPLPDPSTLEGVPHAEEAASRPPQPSLSSDVDRLRADFDSALTSADLEGAIGAILALESALHVWSADTLQSDARDRGRRELRSMVVRLGDLALAGAGDPREPLTPLVGVLLELRGRAREAKDFATGDFIRDRLAAAGIAVQDTPRGQTWDLA